MLACLRSVWVCIAPRSFVTLSLSGAASKRASHGGESTPHLSFPPIRAITIAASPFSFAIGLTSHEKATYHPPAVIRRLAKPFWHNVTRDVNRRHRTATRKKLRKEAGRRKKTKRTTRVGWGKGRGLEFGSVQTPSSPWSATEEEADLRSLIHRISLLRPAHPAISLHQGKTCPAKIMKLVRAELYVTYSADN